VIVEDLPVDVKVDPSPDEPTEGKSCKLFMRAAIIISRIKTPDSRYTVLLRKLKRKMCRMEKEKLREKLQQEISTALEAGGIPRGMIRDLTMVFVTTSIEDIELVHAETGESIKLYFRCMSLQSLLRLREMILSGLLLRLLIEVIKHFLQSLPRVQLLVQAEYFNKCLSRFYTATCMSEFFCLTVNCLTANCLTGE